MQTVKRIWNFIKEKVFGIKAQKKIFVKNLSADTTLEQISRFIAKNDGTTIELDLDRLNSVLESPRFRNIRGDEIIDIEGKAIEKAPETMEERKAFIISNLKKQVDKEGKLYKADEERGFRRARNIEERADQVLETALWYQHQYKRLKWMKDNNISGASLNRMLTDAEDMMRELNLPIPGHSKNVYKIGSGPLRSIKGSGGAIEAWGWFSDETFKNAKTQNDFNRTPDAYVFIDPSSPKEKYIRYSFTKKEFRRQGANEAIIQAIREAYPNLSIVRGMIDNPAILEAAKKFPGATLRDGSPIPSFKTEKEFYDWQDDAGQDVIIPPLSGKVSKADELYDTIDRTITYLDRYRTEARRVVIELFDYSLREMQDIARSNDKYIGLSDFMQAMQSAIPVDLHNDLWKWVEDKFASERDMDKNRIKNPETSGAHDYLIDFDDAQDIAFATWEEVREGLNEVLDRKDSSEKQLSQNEMYYFKGLGVALNPFQITAIRRNAYRKGEFTKWLDWLISDILIIPPSSSKKDNLHKYYNRLKTSYRTNGDLEKIGNHSRSINDRDNLVFKKLKERMSKKSGRSYGSTKSVSIEIKGVRNLSTGHQNNQFGKYNLYEYLNKEFFNKNKERRIKWLSGADVIVPKEKRDKNNNPIPVEGEVFPGESENQMGWDVSYDFINETDISLLNDFLDGRGADIFAKGDIVLSKGAIEGIDSNKIDNEVQWNQVRYKSGARQPRLTAYYGDSGTDYIYSGVKNTPMKWTPELLRLKKIVESITGVEFNSALINKYRNQNDSIAYHEDSEAELGPTPFIASVSFGDTVSFNILDKSTGQITEIPLSDNDLLVMQGDSQNNFAHGIDKSTDARGQRINITFRRTSLPKSGVYKKYGLERKFDLESAKLSEHAIVFASGDSDKIGIVMINHNNFISCIIIN